MRENNIDFVIELICRFYCTSPLKIMINYTNTYIAKHVENQNMILTLVIASYLCELVTVCCEEPN